MTMANLALTDEQRASKLTEDAREAKTFWQARDDQMRFDRTMLKQAYRAKVAHFELFLSNEPRVLHNMAVSLMASKPPRITLPITQQDAAEQDRMNDAELFCQGAFRQITRRWRRRGNRDWLRDFIWYIASGNFAIFPNVQHEGSSRKGVVDIECDIWDPIQVYPVLGFDGMAAVYRIYKTSVEQARAQAKANGWDAVKMDSIQAGADVEIVNAFWIDDEGVNNAVLVDGRMVKAPEVDEAFGDSIPVIMAPVSGDPYRAFDHESQNTPQWTQSWSEGVIAPNRDTYLNFDRLLTYSLQIAHDNAFHKFMEFTENGLPSMTQPEFLDAMLIPKKAGVGEDIRAIQVPSSPKERDTMLDYLVGAMQRGGLSHVIFGSLGIEISGVTLERLLSATKTTLQPFIETAQFGLSEMFMKIMDIYHRSKAPPVDLEVTSKEVGPQDRMMIKNFSRKMLPQTAWVKVELPLALPENLLARVEGARRLIGDPNRPLASEYFVQENMLQIQDVAVERERIREDEARHSPLFTMAADIEAMRALADDQAQRGNQRLATSLHRIADAQEAQLLQSLAPPPGQNEGGPARRLVEPSPEVSPPEDSGVAPSEVGIATGSPTGPGSNNRPASTILEKRFDTLLGRRG